MDELLDELLLARGVARDDLARAAGGAFPARPVLLQGHGQNDTHLADAVQSGETIAIFGDCMSTARPSAALLVLPLLRRLGAEPIVYIPDRLMEGYGPSSKALVELKGRGASVAVSVDSGAQAFEALDEAQAAGLEVIVVDHRERRPAPGRPWNDQPEPPRRKRRRRRGGPRGGRHGFPIQGVALLRELRKRGAFKALTEPESSDLLDLVALGGGAGVGRLRTLNRAFVTQGLKVMAARLDVQPFGAGRGSPTGQTAVGWDLGEPLGPRINADSKVGKSNLGVGLKHQPTPRPRTIATELNRLNEERRAIEMLVCEKPEEQATNSMVRPR